MTRKFTIGFHFKRFCDNRFSVGSTHGWSLLPLFDHLIFDITDDDVDDDDDEDDNDIDVDVDDDASNPLATRYPPVAQT